MTNDFGISPRSSDKGSGQWTADVLASHRRLMDTLTLTMNILQKFHDLKKGETSAYLNTQKEFGNILPSLNERISDENLPEDVRNLGKAFRDLCADIMNHTMCRIQEMPGGEDAEELLLRAEEIYLRIQDLPKNS